MNNSMISNFLQRNAELRSWIVPLLLTVIVGCSLTYQGPGTYYLLALTGLLLLVLTAAYLLWHYRDGLQRPGGGPVLWYIAFALWAVASALWSISIVSSAMTDVTFVIIIGTLLLGYWASDDLIRRLIPLLAILAIGTVAWATYEYNVSNLYRARGPFLNWNSLAAFLNLPLLLICGEYLSPQRNIRGWVAGAAAAALMFGIAMTLSRGAVAGFLLGYIVLYLASRSDPISRRRIFRLLAWIGIGYLLGNLAVNGGTLLRIGDSLTNQNMMSGRLLIWKAAWHLYQQMPFLGSGMDTFWIRYPAVRPILDLSSGQHAHNDYLEILVDLGPIGLVLLGGLTVSLLRTGYRLLRKTQETSRRLEAVSASAAVLAVMAHTFVTFNMFNIQIMLVTTLLFGRMQRLDDDRRGRVCQLQPAKTFTPFGFRLIVILLAGIPALWLTAIFISDRLEAHSTQVHNVSRSVALLQRAQAIYPLSDVPALMIAMRLNGVLASDQSLSADQRRYLVTFGMHELHHALILFPDRWVNYRTQARLVRAEPEGYSSTQVVALYRKSLTIDPTQLGVRIELANYLQQLGQQKQALATLEQGWDRSYYEDIRVVLNYLQLLEQARLGAGDKNGAAQAQTEYDRIQATLKTFGYRFDHFRVGHDIPPVPLPNWVVQ